MKKHLKKEMRGLFGRHSSKMRTEVNDFGWRCPSKQHPLWHPRHMRVPKGLASAAFRGSRIDAI
jgi:hypothetical protein